MFLFNGEPVEVARRIPTYVVAYHKSRNLSTIIGEPSLYSSTVI